MSARVRLLGWVAIVAASLALLVVAAVDQGGTESDAERIQRLAQSYACPQCRGQSVAESNAAVAVTIRQFITDSVTAGQTDREIRDQLLVSFDARVLLNPPADGFAALIWVLPVVLVVVGTVGVGAAVTARRPDDREVADGDHRPPPRRRIGPVAAVAALVFAVGAGWLLARSAGERGVGDALTGQVASNRQRVFDCQELGETGQVIESLQCFDEVLTSDPDNVEALTYRGWYVVLATASARAAGQDDEAAELLDVGRTYLDRAVAVDPTFPDARAFRSVVYDRLGLPVEACAELSALLALDPAPMIVGLTQGVADRNDC